ncbi:MULTISPECIES: branched-chain amino acid ABC transporter substrate-binding protein [Marinobacter]|jgi:branched-chain amino acid transport system substrate-binding protein|uniref:Amino acid ABC transporter substrate-binding protein n=2 Tax=Marinobacteraceae TaxID=2887365 RepID=W5YRD4_9GAMM|nr:MULTISPECIES: branched-chain amino acid ABC transporter substrate-binding protein [Marinobacter]AHI31610.1 amino acid ABC transporter substrate-binding protein [Marinobacter salarius]ARM82970.1 leucine-, isoleucine-, valine-, threonine-, and alanine-binding protein [Marinobacter salarius]AZR41829.1 leu/Ile/Val-binding protein like protein [Marinobacter salarius]KXJ42556.1 MAG: leucine ABC transporter subunit substrate-binding protein LivK [Marinobacter sp. Hex_13]MBJ7278485.1 branched-chain
MRTPVKKLVSAVATSIAVMGAGQAAAEIKIGIAGPMTGPVAQYGDMQFSGARMAIEQINANGGVMGEKLVAVEQDDVCDPKQAVSVANNMVNEGVRFVVGHLCSSSTQPASDIYEDEGILMVTPASTSPDITERGYELVFRTIGLDSMQGPVAANYLISQKPERVAVVHDKQQYGEGIATAVRDTLEEAGVEVAMFEGITAGAKDFSSLVTKLRQADVDYVYYGGYHPELGLILRQAQQADLDATFMGPEGVGNKDINTIAGEAAEGLLVTLPPSFDEKDENQELVQAFEEKGEDPSGPFVLTSYTAVQLIADGIEAAESTDPFDVAEALRAGTFQTPIGTVEYDNKGDMESFEFVVYEWHSDGSKTPVN